MAHHELLDLIRREAERAVRKFAPGHRFGIVSNYNPAGPSVRVNFLDDLDENGQPTLSPWMPIIEPSAGAGSGDIAAPQLGSQAVVIHFGYGDQRFTFMLGTVRSSLDPVPPEPGTDTTPAGAPEKERWIVHPSGTALLLRNDGTVLTGALGGTFKRLATEDFVLNVYNDHTHQYSPGDGTPTQTAGPNTTVASGDTTNLTAQLKAT